MLIRNIFSRNALLSTVYIDNIRCNLQTFKLYILFNRNPRISESFKIQKRSIAIMKINTPEFQAILTPELHTLISMFKKYNHDIRIVGGAVRDILSGIQPHDLDLATTATPEEMKKMFSDEQIRTFNTKGEKHGTVSARINDKENFEITTLRVDVKTDGRHAEVEFTKKWEIDAARRDLTINSLYLGFDGTVYDYYGGYEDLKNKRILFVGDAAQRIQEDYLRILRYFRFYGRIVDDPNSHDKNTLNAIEQNVEGLKKISGERMWSELQRILTGRFTEQIVKTMIDTGLGPYIALHPRDELDFKSFEKICSLKSKYAYEAATYIGALLPDENKVLDFHERMKLSSNARNLAVFIASYKMNTDPEPIENPLRPYQDLLLNSTLNRLLVREYIYELLRFKDRPDLIEAFQSWIVPTMPVNGIKLKEKGLKYGHQIGFVLQTMKTLWIQSDFKATEDELMEKLPEILESFPSKKKRVS